MRNQWGDEKAFEFLWEGGKVGCLHHFHRVHRFHHRTHNPAPTPNHTHAASVPTSTHAPRARPAAGARTVCAAAPPARAAPPRGLPGLDMGSLAACVVYLAAALCRVRKGPSIA